MRLVIFGAGGQARETAWIAKAMGGIDVLGFVVSDLSKLGPHDSADRVLGDLSWLAKNRASVDAIALGVGMPKTRAKLASVLCGDFGKLVWPNIIHPSAIVDSGAFVANCGVLIAPRVTVMTDVRLNPFSFINSGATVGHDSVIERCACIMPGANISGGVVVGAESLVGTGAQVLQYLRVGKRAQVGAGAVVTKDVPDDATVVGVPAQVTA